MKKVNVMIKDKNTLVLMEDASSGDLISLDEIIEVDYSYLDSLVEKGKDSIYSKKLEDYKKILDLEHQKDLNDKLQKLNNNISDLSHELERVNKEKEFLLREKENEVEKKYIDIISGLNHQIELLNITRANDIRELNISHEKAIGELNNKLNSFSMEYYVSVFNLEWID
jgi:predicted  nucleic acid-binding Zn-ribbon protein